MRPVSLAAKPSDPRLLLHIINSKTDSAGRGRSPSDACAPGLSPALCGYYKDGILACKENSLLSALLFSERYIVFVIGNLRGCGCAPAFV